MKDYASIVTKVTSTPWMIEENALKMMLELLEAHLSGSISQEDIRIRVESAGRRAGDSRVQRAQAIGIIPLHGPIFPKANLMTEMSGATDLQQFRSDFRALMADESVGGILMDIDSPGGLSDMVDEMAAEVRAAREVKPVYAIANTAANSAAYYIGSQATKMFSTPSGQVGSIGTFLVHQDDSAKQKLEGVERTVVKAGRFKAVTMEPLTAEGHSYLQEYVNQQNDLFVNAVAEGRGVSEDHVRQYFGEGGIVGPKSALDKGMIDGVATSEQVLSQLASNLTGGGVPASQTGNVTVVNVSGVPDTRQSYDADKEHSEPGTGQGGEPTPREPPEKGDPAIENGWRRDPPPPAYETEESTGMNREWLVARATALKIEFNDETTDEELATAISERVDTIVVPINDAAVTAEQSRQWEQDYPDQARELARLRQSQDTNDAVLFANEYARFEGETRGFSTLVRDGIKDAHLKISSGQFGHDDLKTLLDSVAKKEATVPLGEVGSDRQPDDGEKVLPANNVRDTRKQFSDLVNTAMTEDGLDRKAAIKHVSESNPELAAAYLGQR